MTTPDAQRLTLVSSSLGSGGAERVLSQLANRWAEQGRDVTFVTVFDAASDFYALHPGVRRVALGLGERSGNLVAGLRNNARRVSVLRRAIVESRPLAVLAFVDQTNVLTVAATAGLGLRVVVSERNNPVDMPRSWRLLRRVTYPFASAVVVQTTGAARWMEGVVPRSKLAIVPNPVSRLATPGRAAGERAPRIVALGRLIRQKGFDLLIRAFAQVAPRFPSWELVIAGEGPDRTALEQLRDGLGLGGRVRLPGRTDRPFPLLQEAAVFALSSRYEGFPNVLLEAMACGAASVATDCDHGPRDILRDGVDGLLVRPDDADALAAALGRVMGDPGLRARISGSAPDVSRRFHLDGIERAWRDILFPPGEPQTRIEDR